MENSSNVALGGDSNEQDRYIAPTVLADVTFKDGVMQEEVGTTKILIIVTDRSAQTVWTQIRLLLEEQSDQSLHCLLFQLQLLYAFYIEKPNCSVF